MNKFVNLKINRSLHRVHIKSIVVVILASLLATISIQWFIVPAATLPDGVMGVTMGVTSTIFNYGTTNYLAMFWTLYFVALVPFALLGWFTISKQFTFYSCVFTVLASVFGVIFSKAIPSNAAEYEIFGKAVDVYGVTINVGIRLGYSLIGTIGYATALVVALLNGGSSGGTDFVAAYYVKRRKTNISFILAVLSVGSLFISVVLFGIIGMQYKQGIAFSNINYNSLLVTLAFSIMQSIVGPIYIYFLYRKDKEVIFTITSKSLKEISKFLSGDKKNYLILESDASSMKFVTILSQKAMTHQFLIMLDKDIKISSKCNLKKRYLNPNIWE